ncbi:T9SS type A sorting domain-containing protein [Chryseobacterium sp. GMJ5]|uniref:T9SS type A sorting domain-containing protein n=1 Tax=Chryseobacterium gilvum TaxID=2976534 RepID=A0ABT2VTD4_9FLAO|nr:T9SS type A sorting domain-containing protein [Chryseobacterium gilvum]MCU7613256.1 T9SS type A sorting domain-containing protein [Chryseobacterium gilvum]
MKKILLACMMTLGVMSSAQISYTYGWEPTGLGSWTTSGSGSFSRSTTTPCTGTGSVRANNYYNASSFLVSPALTGTNGGNLTVNFSYKVTQYSSNTTAATAADFGVIKLDWATSASGPWTTAYTIDNTTHVVSAACAAKTATISGLPAAGNVFIRFEAKSGLSTSDNYVYFDDITISQGAAPSCVGPTALAATGITSSGANITWTASTSVPAGGYDLYYSTSSTAPTSTTTPNYVSIAGTSQALSGLSAGTPYYVWVRSHCTTVDQSAWTAYTFATKPLNDDCAAAVALTVNPDLSCAASTAGTTVGATDSGVAVTTCTGTADDDVWYKFVATNANQTITLSNVVSTGTSSSTSLYTQVLSGTCGTLTSVACGTTNVTSVTGLTVGQTYYVRAYNSNGAGYSNSFNICVGTPPPPPANDVCSGAVALTVAPVFTPITGTTVSAFTDGTTTCQSFRGNNVWYSVVVPASGTLTIETKGVTGSPLTDTVLSVHGGTCGGTFTDIACDDDTGDDNFSKISLTGQTPGATLYVSVWRYTNNSSNLDGQFQLSAYDASVLATSESAVAKNNIKAYPNPFSDVLNISDVAKVKSVSVSDVSGRLVKTIDSPSSALHLEELKSGLYLVTLNMKDGSQQTIKAIKK